MFHETYELIIAGLGAAVAIVIAIYAIIQANSSKSQANTASIQTELLKKEFDLVNRPWVGSSDAALNTKDTSLNFYYHNYGNLLARNLIEKIGVTLTKITREDIPNLTPEKTATGAIVFPKQNRHFGMTDRLDIRAEAKEKNQPIYYWVTIDYEYLEKSKGKYGTIITLFNNSFEVIDEWAT